MSRESTIERIKKLLELAANNPSEAEATAAALAAQRLIAQHDVRDEELMHTALHEASRTRSCSASSTASGESLRLSVRHWPSSAPRR